MGGHQPDRRTLPHAPKTAAAWQAGRTVVAASLALLTGCTISSVDTQRLDELFNEIPDGEPGCAAAVYDDDRIAWTGVRGLADKEERLLITNDTTFAIGPTGQGFIATAVLLLAERRELDLDDPIRDHLPTLPAWADTVTAKHLLQRTSGIPDYSEFPDVTTAFYRVIGDDILDVIRRLERPRWEPGTRFSGQWSDDVLQSFLVEAVADRPLPEFLAEEVFSVAGIDVRMEASVDGPDVAASYQSAGSGPVPEPDRAAVGDVGIHTTASDLAKWGAEYWEPSVGGEELLQERTAHMVVAQGGEVTGEGPPKPGEGGRWAAGVFAFAGGGFVGIGDDLGFTSALVVESEERVAAAVLCNHLGHEPGETASALTEAYIAAR